MKRESRQGRPSNGSTEAKRNKKTRGREKAERVSKGFFRNSSSNPAVLLLLNNRSNKETTVIDKYPASSHTARPLLFVYLFVHADFVSDERASRLAAFKQSLMDSSVRHIRPNAQRE